MKVVYYQQRGGNFGDDLNRWLWPQLIGEWVNGFCSHDRPEATSAADLLFYGIGTLLDQRMPADGDKVVFGSGAGYGQLPLSLPRCRVFFVRGRLTAKALNLDPGLGITDPAILVRDYFPVIPQARRRHDVAFMPHHSTVVDDHWQRACEAAGCHYIDPAGQTTEQVIRQIADSRRLITEAMHGAIVADALRVPWLSVSSGPQINRFKWRDWCDSLALDYTPAAMLPIYSLASGATVKRFTNRIKCALRTRQLQVICARRLQGFQLSDDRLSDRKLAAVHDKLDELKNYLGDRYGPSARHAV